MSLIRAGQFALCAGYFAPVDVMDEIIMRYRERRLGVVWLTWRLLIE
jgi:ABC-type polysaccharide/polyol phosphate export permease